MIRELEQERAYVDRAHRRLIELYRRAGLVASSAGAGDPELEDAARPERDAAVAHAVDRRATLAVPRDRLAVGRLDMEDREARYVGRAAVADDHGDPLVIDWRAPAAAAFYRARPGDRQGVVRRRHFRWRHGEMVGLDDELLDVDGGAGLELVGEAALLAAVTAPRTGRMTDVVATLQAEQDEVIRRPRAGLTLVQGGPGTGKTAVALHRAAYLLYAEGLRLARTGVLFVGPTRHFLRYVEDVVPSLGEDRVVLLRAAELAPPGIEVTASDPPAVEAVKGDARMATVLARAVRDCERPLREPAPVACGRYQLEVGVDASRRAVRAARRARGTHNARRGLLAQRVVGVLQGQLEERHARDRRLGLPDPPRRLRDGVDEAAVVATLDRMWPVLTPSGLVRALLTQPRRLRRAADGVLAPEEVDVLLTAPDPRDVGWSEADAALWDEAAALLGDPVRRGIDWAVVTGGRRRRRAEAEPDPITAAVLEAMEVAPPCPSCGEALALHRGGAEPSWECTHPDCGDRWSVDEVGGDATANLVAAVHDRVAETFGDPVEQEVRPADQLYGHVVIDEAQDVSGMQWRAIVRRCPSRSMTVVGDLAQASRPTAASSWDEVVARVDGDVATGLCELTVNYRTPGEVMELAGRVLRTARPDLTPPASVRSEGVSPRLVVGPLDVGGLVGDLRVALGEGTVGVVVPDSFDPEAAGAPMPGPDADVDVVTVAEAKGLEFDGVIVVEPATIVAEHPAGLSRLFVAMTRPTRRLWVAATSPLRPPLDELLAPVDDGTVQPRA